MARRLVAFALFASWAALGCASAPPPPPEEPKEEPKKQQKESKLPTMEYDLGAISPDIWKKRIDSLKSSWNDCYLERHKKHETLAGKMTFVVHTVKDGSVKWAIAKQSDLGDRTVEKCVLDSLKATNFGAPMDSKEGEGTHTYGWELDDDDRPADPAAGTTVYPALEKAKKKLDECRKSAGSSAKFDATFYVGPKGKPISVGIAIDDPSGEDAVDCLVEVMMKLTYVNKTKWPTKVQVQLP